VALKQPVTAEQVNAVRGVASLATLETLQKRKLIAPAPLGSGVGRARQWRTTQEFLTEFGISRIEEIYAAGKIDQIFGSDSGTFS
jgi:segregation and condensation protein B